MNHYESAAVHHDVANPFTNRILDAADEDEASIAGRIGT